jgi:hypothetical protein
MCLQITLITLMFSDKIQNTDFYNIDNQHYKNLCLFV